MRVHLGCDHAGFELKEHLRGWLSEQGHQVVDHGAFVFDPGDDYPPFCIDAATAVAADPDSLGVLFGGSGNGEQMAANKVRGVRAVLAWNEETARLAREHNDANVVSLGARMHTREQMEQMVALFLATPYSGEERHDRRIAMVAAYERTGALPPGTGV